MTATAIPVAKESKSRPTGISARRRKHEVVTAAESKPAAAGRAANRLASVWLLTTVALAVGLVLTGLVAPLGPLGGPIAVPFWVLAPAFALGEVAVVHMRFRKNAHSFSMSEIPLIIGLFSASPLVLIAAQATGGVAAFVLHRKQSAVRAVFNVAASIVVTATTISIFRLFVTNENALGYQGWASALVAVAVGIFIANALVHLAIRLSGGRNTASETASVLAFTSLGATINTSLGLIGVIILWTDPAAAWLAVAPPVVLYVAYRAYVSQRLERARLQSLYEASRRVHGASHIEGALETGCSEAISMLGAERAEIVLFSETASRLGYRTSVSLDGVQASMSPVILQKEEQGEMVANGAAVLKPADCLHIGGDLAVKDAVVAPLSSTDASHGYLLVINRLDDVSTFESADAQLLATLAGHITVSLKNGRLEDSLEELTRLKEKLELEVKSKDEFVASVSHELRTPLTGIVGLSSELVANREFFDDDEVNDVLSMISEQSSELANIVEDLLVGARADAGSLMIKSEVIDLTKEISAVVSAHALLGSDGHPDVPITLPVRFAQGDALRFRQIVRNLLTNAARYGGDNVTVESSRRGERIVVSVADDGPGVPVGQEDSIFDAYQRAHNAVGQPASVGLGLSVARKLAELMGGDLFYRRFNDTTMFELSLPVAESIPVAESAGQRI